MKKTPKKPCKKACKKTCEKLCVDPDIRKIAMEVKPTLNVILKNIVDDNRNKLNLYSDIAVKAGEVLKFLLQLVKESKESYDNLARMLERQASPKGIKIDKVDLGKKGISVKSEGVSPIPRLFDMLLEKSRYDFSGFDVDYRRVPRLDTDYTLAFEFRISRKAETTDGITTVTQDSAIVHASMDMQESVDAFDNTVSRLFTNVPLKKTCDTTCKVTLKPVDKKACEKVRKAVKAKKAKVVPVIEDLKRTVLECSRYAVPSSRVKFVAFRVDVKHQNLVYELRFYQKSTKSVPVDNLSYEPAYLNVRMHGDRDDLIAKRFDKIVENLRFNEFPKKK